MRTQDNVHRQVPFLSTTMPESPPLRKSCRSSDIASRGPDGATTTTAKSELISELELSARLSFEQTMQLFINRPLSSQDSSHSNWFSSILEGIVHPSGSKNNITEQDRDAQQLDALIKKHQHEYGIGMKEAVVFFNMIVPEAWDHPDSASAEQRKSIKDFLKQVLQSGVPITAEGIESALKDVIQACNGEARGHKRFYRLCVLWFDMFLSEDEGQSNPLGTKVVDFMRTASATEQEDLARLWKFTHTSY